MIDKALFLGTSSAANSMQELTLLTNNLANANTPGFRADYQTSARFHGAKKDIQSRAYSALGAVYSDFKQGPVLQTGRDLDVSISGSGFIAVQTNEGKEGYTRAGNLQIRNGVLVTQNGNVVLGTGGAITIPDSAENVSIGNDGTVSMRPKGENVEVNLNRIKLTNPDVHTLHKGSDGLFYVPGEGETSPADTTVKLTPGSLEGSNVNTVEALTHLIDVSRHFEMHTSMMKTIENMASKGNQILEVPR